MSVGFYTSKSGKLSHEGDHGYFGDILLQEIFLNQLDSSIDIDPYDGGVCEVDSIVFFMKELNDICEKMEGFSENLNLSDEHLKSYYRRSETYKLNLESPKKQLLKDVKRLKDIADIAYRNEYRICFTGE